MTFLKLHEDNSILGKNFIDTILFIFFKGEGANKWEQELFLCHKAYLTNEFSHLCIEYIDYCNYIPKMEYLIK